MLRLKNGGYDKPTAVVLAVAVALTAAAYAFAEDELTGGDALVSVYADLKAKAAVEAFLKVPPLFRARRGLIVPWRL